MIVRVSNDREERIFGGEALIGDMVVVIRERCDRSNGMRWNDGMFL